MRLCVCVCVCVCVCLCVCVTVCVCVIKCNGVPIYVHVCTCVCVCVSICVCMCVCVHMHVCLWVCAWVFINCMHSICIITVYLHSEPIWKFHWTNAQSGTDSWNKKIISVSFFFRIAWLSWHSQIISMAEPANIAKTFPSSVVVMFCLCLYCWWKVWVLFWLNGC